MAHKIFNKFKEPKFAEFSRKDLVVDIKNGDLYYKSNLGVHKVPSEVSSDSFGTPPTTTTLTGNTFKVTGQRDGDSSITGSLTLVGNLSASGNLFADLSSAGNDKVVFFNSTTGELTQEDAIHILSSSALATSITGAFTALSASIANDLNTVVGSDTFKSTGTRNGDSQITGSLVLTSDLTASNGLISNNLTVGGTITAQEFHTEFVSASIIFESGSTKFGDTLNDTHDVTGSLNVTGSINVISSKTMGLGNLGNAHILIGNSTTGLGLDPNEIMFKGGNGHFGTIGSHNLLFVTDGTSRGVVTSGGFFGFGTTTITSDARVFVEGNISASGEG